MAFDSSLREASDRQLLKSNAQTPSRLCRNPFLSSQTPLPSQERLVSRFLEDADGFNDKGEPTGEEPSGVWAEIAPFGGAGANSDNAR